MPTTGAEIAPDVAPDADQNIPNSPDQVFSYYTVSGATLRGRSSTAETTYIGSCCVYLTAGTGFGLLLDGDLPLPQGSLIRYLRIYDYDTNASNGVRALSTRYGPGTDAIGLVSVTSTAAFVAGYGTTLSPVISEVVGGVSHACTVIGWPDAAGSANRICGMRVAYCGPIFFASGFEDSL